MTDRILTLGRSLRSAWSTSCEALSTARTPGDIAVLCKRWSHHARRSGYDPIADGLGVRLSGDAVMLPGIIATRSPCGGTDRVGRKAGEVDLAMRILRRRRLLIVDGDNSLPLAARLRHSVPRSISAVFHLPPSTLADRLREADRSALDGAICVARHQMPVAADAIGADRVRFIPHGVDTTWFTPAGPAARSASPTLIFAGVHRRDFALLSRIARGLRAARRDVRVIVVAPVRHLPADLDARDLELHLDVDDSSLLALYRQSWALLMPILETTANNAVLEALACGLPVIITRTGGAADYVNPECGYLCTGDETQYVHAALQLFDDPGRLDLMARQARSAALLFDWNAVRQQVRQFLDAVDCRRAAPLQPRQA